MPKGKMEPQKVFEGLYSTQWGIKTFVSSLVARQFQTFKYNFKVLNMNISYTSLTRP